MSVTVAKGNGDNDKCLEYKNITTMCTDTDECKSGVAECGQVCVNTEGSFHCSCYSGYKLTEDGVNCTDIDECTEMDNEGCDHSCVNTVGSYNCSCDTGYRLGNDSQTCEDVDECVENKNATCNETCINIDGSYYCSCLQGYRLASDGYSCADIDECEERTSGCHDQCTNTIGSYYCSCPSGYELSSDLHACIDINECSQNPCPQNCTNTPGSYQCSCWRGYEFPVDCIVHVTNGSTCVGIQNDTDYTSCANVIVVEGEDNNVTCIDRVENTEMCIDINECTSGVAECSEVCVNTEGSFHCSCYDPGYKLAENGVSCTDVDECSQNACPQNCTNTPGSYQCSCWRGYEFPVDCIVHVSNNSTCSSIQNDTDYTSCATVTVVEGEDKNGTCIDRVENTEMCIDINECTSGVAECSEVCVNTEGSFQCSCYDTGYKPAEDRVNCTDVDECSQNVCPQNCTNTLGSYQCSCWRGYEFPVDCIVYITNNSECFALQNNTDYSSCMSVTVAKGNGDNDKCLGHKNITSMCTDMDECTSGVAECGQVCVNTEGSFHCSCNSGYKLTEDGVNCTDINECSEMDNGGCDHSCVNTVGSYNCSCDTGYRLGNDSHTCEDIDECVDENNGGCNQTCINTPGSYYCSCRQEYRLTDDGHSCAIDECELGIHECHQVCIDTQESYNCSCISGYELDSDQLTCIDIDECEQNLASCAQGCDNLIGSFSCYCHSGYYPTLDGVSCIKIPSLEKLNITLPDPGLKVLLSYVTISDDYCAYIQGIFITLKNFGYLVGYVTVEKGVLLARLNVSKELNAYDVLGGLFGNDHSILLPVNSRIELIKYNCSSNEFSLKTLRGGKMNVFPHFLELSSVSFNITVVKNIIPRLGTILFQGVWSIGSLSCNVSLDTTRTGQWPFQVACDHNQFNVNEFLEIMNLEFKSFLPIELLFGLEHMNGTIYTQDDTISILVELEGVVSIEDWLTVKGCIVVYQDIRLREPPQILIGSSCSSSGPILSLSSLVHELMGVDISNVPFFGDLELPEFRAVIPSVNTNIPDRFLPGSTMLRNLAKSLKVAKGITFVFESTFCKLTLDIAITIPSFDVAKLSFIPIPNPDIGKLKVRCLLESLVHDFIPPTFSGAISDLSVLDLNVEEFEFDLDQRIVKLMAMYNRRFSIFFNRIVIENILTRMCLNLSSSELEVFLKGQFRIGPTLIECEVAINTAQNSFKLTAKSPKVCLVHIAEALPISIPSIMVETFKLNTLCVRDVTIMLDSANGYTFCFCGTVSLWSRSFRLSVCTDHSSNLLIGFTLKAFSLPELLSKFVGSIARRIPLLNHILDISILFTESDREQSNILSSLQCVDMPTLYPKLAKPGLTIKGTATWPESCGIDIFCHVLKFFVGKDVVLPFKLYFPRNAPSLPLISVDFTLPEFPIGLIRLNQPRLTINLPTVPSLPFSLDVSGSVNLLGLKFTAGVKYLPLPPSVTLFLHTKQSWTLVPFVESCNLFLSVTLSPTPSPIPGFSFGVDGKIGIRGCKRLEVRAIASYDPNGLQSYLYAKMDMPLTIESILKAFCINIPLPSFIGDMGFPDGFIASYSQADHYLPYFDLYISKGLYFKGTLSYWGARVAIEVKYTPGPPRDYFYIKLRLPVVRLFGNALFMSESRAVRNKGPFLNVSIDSRDSSVSGRASIFVNVLKISMETILSITGNEISFSIRGSILGLFEAEVTLSGEYKSNLAAMNLNVVATLKLDFFNFITNKVKSIVSNIKKGADLITAPLKSAFSAAQKVFDSAAEGVRVATDKVRGLENQVGGARGKVGRIRNKINSVCHIQNCRSVSVSFPCGLSCSWRGCSVKYCQKSVTDPVCQVANTACRALKAPWEALLRGAEATLRGFEGLLSAARSALNGAQSLLRSASSGLESAKRALESAKSKLGSVLNVVAAILQLGIDNLFRIHSVMLGGMLNTVGGGRFEASIDMTIIRSRIKEKMVLTLSNPTELINYAVNYIKSPFGRKKRSSLKPKWLLALLDQAELAKAPKVAKARTRSIDKVRRLAELSKMYGSGFPFIDK